MAHMWLDLQISPELPDNIMQSEDEEETSSHSPSILPPLPPSIEVPSFNLQIDPQPMAVPKAIRHFVTTTKYGKQVVRVYKQPSSESRRIFDYRESRVLPSSSCPSPSGSISSQSSLCSLPEEHTYRHTYRSKTIILHPPAKPKQDKKKYTAIKKFRQLEEDRKKAVEKKLRELALRYDKSKVHIQKMTKGVEFVRRRNVSRMELQFTQFA